MSLNGFMRNIKPLEILTEEQVEAIHRSMLDVLENTGMRIESEKALQIYHKNGCNVDFENKRVRFPSYIVEDAIRKCPSSFTMKSRNPAHNIRIGGNTIYFSDMPGLRILDLETYEIRPATRQENRDAVIVLDALPNIHILCSYTPYFEVEGVSPSMAIPESFVAKIRNSSKVCWEGYQNDCEIFIIEIAKIINQDVMGLGLPSAPLTFYSDACESIIRFANAGLPLNIASGCMMGGTSPVTVAGTLTTFNAEVLGGIVLAQMVKPGTRVVVEDTILPMDMRSGHPMFGNIETCLHIAAFAQVWRKYAIPTFADSGWTNSKRIDFQDGYERSMTALLIALSGCHVSNLYGGIYGELAFHPVQAILDDDIAGMIGKFVEGVKVDNETLATGLIEEIGPIPGYFLNTAHTRKFYKEIFIPKSADMLTYTDWAEKGKKDSIDYAKERMADILKNHSVYPIPENQDKEVGKILKKAGDFYKSR